MTMKTTVFLLLILACAIPATAQVFSIDGIEPSYVVGDTISFTITNLTDRTLYFGAAPEYCIYNVLDGCQWIFLAIVVEFAPGEVMERWYDTKWDNCEPGQYRISSTCVEGDWQTDYTIDIDFLLIDPLDTDALPFGGVKSLYR